MNDIEKSNRVYAIAAACAFAILCLTAWRCDVSVREQQLEMAKQGYEQTVVPGRDHPVWQKADKE